MSPAHGVLVLESMPRKLIWVSCVALVTSASAALGYRLLVRAWRVLRHEEPPELPGWARLVGIPLRRRVLARLHAAMV